MTYLYLFFALVCNAVANILMKLGSQQFSDGLRQIFQEPQLFFRNGYFFAGLLFFMMALIFYTLVLSRLSLSVAYPIMTGFGFMIVILFSVYSLGEQLWWWQILGVGFVLLGVILLSHGAIR